MTLDEEIKHQEGITDRYTGMSEYAENEATGEECARVAADHRQLAEWLRELVAYRKLRICGNCRHYVSGTTHFGECHVTSDIEPCVVCVCQTACDTFFDYKDFRNGVEKPKS